MKINPKYGLEHVVMKDKEHEKFGTILSFIIVGKSRVMACNGLAAAFVPAEIPEKERWSLLTVEQYISSRKTCGKGAHEVTIQIGEKKITCGKVTTPRVQIPDIDLFKNTVQALTGVLKDALDTCEPFERIGMNPVLLSKVAKALGIWDDINPRMMLKATSHNRGVLITPLKDDEEAYAVVMPVGSSKPNGTQNDSSDKSKRKGGGH